MKRIALTNENGAWFDVDKAQKFSEETYWNGNNFISKATGSPWGHENLFLTASGKWVLNTWSNFQGTQDTYEQISEDEAARWFAKQEFSYDEIPESLHESVKSLEI